VHNFLQSTISIIQNKEVHVNHAIAKKTDRSQNTFSSSLQYQVQTLVSVKRHSDADARHSRQLKTHVGDGA